VDREHAPPLLVADPHQRIEGRRHRPRAHLGDLLLDSLVDALRVARDSRVVHPDVDRSQLLLDLGQGSVDGSAVRYVDLHRNSVAGQLRRQRG
jgi:hypothetical protein